MIKNRGLKNVLFFNVDGLVGFKEVIYAIFPDAQIRRYVIYKLWNSFKYAIYKDLKKFASDFKNVYNAPTESVALAELELVKNTRMSSVTGKMSVDFPENKCSRTRKRN